MAYQRRIVDDVLDELFPHLAAIALEGAKGVGKTATASQRAQTILSLNEPRQREALAADLDHVTRVRAPVLIDEWQLEPNVWDRVRRAVDDDSSGGRFESLVTQSLRVYAAASDAHLSHLRTKNTDHEIDLIVEGTDRRIVAIEVKLAATTSDKDVRHLNWLQAQLGDRLADRVVVTTGEFAYRRPDGVAVVPLALLGP